MRTVLSTSQLKALKERVGDNLYTRLPPNRPICAAPETGACFVSFPFYDIANEGQKETRIYIYCNTSDIIFLLDSPHCLELLEQIDDKQEPFRQMLDFLLALTGDDVYVLHRMEDAITNLEDHLLTRTNPDDDSGIRVISLRRILLRMKRYYEQLTIVTSDLAESTNGIVPAHLHKRFAALDRRVDHLLDSVRHLQEYTTQAREAYQAQVDIEQNQIMKIFTVITAIFLPLTLIVGWYGMNFPMPEYAWSKGYAYVILLSVAVCIACFAAFKKKRWF